MRAIAHAGMQESVNGHQPTVTTVLDSQVPPEESGPQSTNPFAPPPRAGSVASETWTLVDVGEESRERFFLAGEARTIITGRKSRRLERQQTFIYIPRVDTPVPVLAPVEHASPPTPASIEYEDVDMAMDIDIDEQEEDQPAIDDRTEYDAGMAEATLSTSESIKSKTASIDGVISNTTGDQHLSYIMMQPLSGISPSIASIYIERDYSVLPGSGGRRIRGRRGVGVGRSPQVKRRAEQECRKETLRRKSTRATRGVTAERMRDGRGRFVKVES